MEKKISNYKNAEKLLKMYLSEIPRKQRYYNISISLARSAVIFQTKFLTLEEAIFTLDRLKVQGTFNFISLCVFNRY